MIILYAHPSQIVLKVNILLEETGMDYVSVNDHTLEEGTPEYLAFIRASPMGQVPAIYDSDKDVALFETSDIMIYLAEKAGQFLPGLDRPQARAETLKWFMFEAATLSPTMLDIYHYTLKAPDPNPYSEERARMAALRAISVLEDVMTQGKGRDFLAVEYSIADMMLYPWLSILEDFADIPLSDYPALEAWTTRMASRTAVQVFAVA